MAAVEAYDAVSAGIITERRAGYFRLYGVYESMGIQRRAASDAVRDLNKLIARNPALLADEPAASEAMLE